MEHKIGEIFKVDGEWYQCLIGNSCGECAFLNSICIDNPSLKCAVDDRNDNCSDVFKKLEKVGKTYEKRVSDGTFSTFQRYKVYNSVILPQKPYMYYNFIDSTIEIEIKQTQEDMEENKTTFLKEYNALTRAVYAYVNGEISDKELIRSIKEMSDEYPYNKNNLKPFDLEAAKAGKPVCTRDGRKARIICFDRICGDDYYKIVACVTAFDGDFEEVLSYGIDGYIVDSQNPKDEDLMMLPEKKEGWVNVYHCLNGISEYACDDIVFGTKEDATQCAKNENNYITTVKIEWEG